MATLPDLLIAEKHDGDIAPDLAAGSAPRDRIRLWLRMLSCTMVIDKQLRALLQAEFGTTLPRFDVLAALDRAPDGLSMGQLSRALLVSNGNVTALVQALVRDGLIESLPSPTDRRAAVVRLTPAGSAAFRAQAARHHALVGALLGGLDRHEADRLYQLLGRVKASIAAARTQAEDKP